MRANPGGEVSRDEVIGRDDLIASLWAALAQQSIVLVAERRAGKTTIIKKMRNQPAPGFAPIYRDVENLSTPLELIERLCEDVRPHLSAAGQVGATFNAILKKFSGGEVAGVLKFPEGVAPHWKELLEDVLRHVFAKVNNRLVFFWDELPLFVHKVKRHSGDIAAIDFLDTLRSLRQTHPKLRMVYTGSIGLHHVVGALRWAGHANDATNDMRTIDVPPLAAHHAEHLAVCLLNGEGVEMLDEQGVARAICKSVDNMPFYIHSLVSALVQHPSPVNPAVVDSVVRQAIVDDHDRWHLQHYYDRLPEYYGHDRLPVVHHVLDELASCTGALSLRTLTSRLCAQIRREHGNTAGRILDGDSAELIEILRLLRRDHYVTQNVDTNEFEFRGNLLKRWWKAFRGL